MQVKNFIYPAEFVQDQECGGYVVRFPDFPEAVTQGDSIEEATREATDCLEEAISNRIIMNLEIPESSKGSKSCHEIALPALTAAKAALYIAMKETEITKMEMAKRMKCDEKEIRRLLNPRHASKISRIEQALMILGKKIIMSYHRAA
jgi:antitoxin HicB